MLVDALRYPFTDCEDRLRFKLAVETHTLDHVIGVILMVPEIEMRRPYARRIITFMQNATISRDITNVDDPRESMCQD